MAYINISNDGQRLVGPLGIKKAEQELIKRRYKQHHYIQKNNEMPMPQGSGIARISQVYAAGNRD